MLRIAGLEAGYGGAQALFGIDLAVAEGEAVSLLGRNGMGKTTTVRAVMGLLRPWAGSVKAAGQDVTGARPTRIARAGLGLVPDLAADIPEPGEQQMLAIGRALMTNPRLLILDEATEGLAPLNRAVIWECLHRLRAEGMAMLVIDKNLDALLRLADRHVVIERGRVVWAGTGAALVAEREVVERALHA